MQYPSAHCCCSSARHLDVNGTNKAGQVLIAALAFGHSGSAGRCSSVLTDMGKGAVLPACARTCDGGVDQPSDLCSQRLADAGARLAQDPVHDHPQLRGVEAGALGALHHQVFHSDPADPAALQHQLLEASPIVQPRFQSSGHPQTKTTERHRHCASDLVLSTTRFLMYSPPSSTSSSKLPLLSSQDATGFSRVGILEPNQRGRWE